MNRSRPLGEKEVVSWILLLIALLVVCLIAERVLPLHQNRPLVIICAECRGMERVAAYDDETVGGWDERMLCSSCKAKGVNAARRLPMVHRKNDG